MMIRSGLVGPIMLLVLSISIGCRSPQPPVTASVLQELRLIAAVEMTHFSEKGQYAQPAELKVAGLLDPAWPRSAARGSHTITCEVPGRDSGFVCYADPRHRESPHYRVDSGQVVRVETGRRPDAGSPPVKE